MVQVHRGLSWSSASLACAEVNVHRGRLDTLSVSLIFVCRTFRLYFIYAFNLLLLLTTLITSQILVDSSSWKLIWSCCCYWRFGSKCAPCFCKYHYTNIRPVWRLTQDTDNCIKWVKDLHKILTNVFFFYNGSYIVFWISVLSPILFGTRHVISVTSNWLISSQLID